MHKPINTAVAPEQVMEARLEYAGRGWRTFPAPADGSKKSLKKKTKKYPVNWGATADPDAIRQEFLESHLHKQNVGLPTGFENGIFVIETDTAEHGKDIDGAAALKKLEASHTPRRIP